MLSKIIQTLSNLIHAKQDASPSREYLKYLKSSYPHNHNYTIKKNKLYPSRELAKRYKRIRELFPDPLTSLVDIGSSKGFFIFAASEYPECARSLGIDIYQYDIDACRWVKEYLHNNKVQFELLKLHELAERIQEFGGPFQTVLLINIYQYLYFGSVRSSEHYLDHDEIFKYLRKICTHRIIFNNRLHLEDCQNVEQIERSSERAQKYSEEQIIAAASKYFNIIQHGNIGQYPLWTFDVKETAHDAASLTELKDIFDKWLNDLEFRDTFKKNPEKALMDAGFQFNPEALQKIKSMLKHQGSKTQDEELDKRINR